MKTSKGEWDEINEMKEETEVSEAENVVKIRLVAWIMRIEA